MKDNLDVYRDLALDLLYYQVNDSCILEEKCLDALDALWATMTAEERVQSKLIDKDIADIMRGLE